MEPEFFLLREAEDGRPEPYDGLDVLDKSCYDLEALLRGAPLLKEIVAAMETVGWGVSALDHEDANGQYEINFDYADVLTTANRFTLLRTLIASAPRASARPAPSALPATLTIPSARPVALPAGAAPRSPPATSTSRRPSITGKRRHPGGVLRRGRCEADARARAVVGGCTRRPHHRHRHADRSRCRRCRAPAERRRRLGPVRRAMGSPGAEAGGMRHRGRVGRLGAADRSAPREHGSWPDGAGGAAELPFLGRTSRPSGCRRRRGLHPAVAEGPGDLMRQIAHRFSATFRSGGRELVICGIRHRRVVSTPAGTG